MRSAKNDLGSNPPFLGDLPISTMPPSPSPPPPPPPPFLEILHLPMMDLFAPVSACNVLVLTDLRKKRKIIPAYLLPTL